MWSINQIGKLWPMAYKAISSSFNIVQLHNVFVFTLGPLKNLTSGFSYP